MPSPTRSGRTEPGADDQRRQWTARIVATAATRRDPRQAPPRRQLDDARGTCGCRSPSPRERRRQRPGRRKPRREPEPVESRPSRDAVRSTLTSARRLSCQTKRSTSPRASAAAARTRRRARRTTAPSGRPARASTNAPLAFSGQALPRTASRATRPRRTSTPGASESDVGRGDHRAHCPEPAVEGQGARPRGTRRRSRRRRPRRGAPSETSRGATRPTASDAAIAIAAKAAKVVI